MFLECSLIGKELHSHTHYANTHLFNFFTANFTAESDETGRKRESDFIEKWGKMVLMKKLLGILVLGLLLSGNAYAEHSLKHRQEQMEERMETINDKNLLKRNGKCQDILESQNKWKFSFSQIGAESYYVNIEGSYPTSRDYGYGLDIFQKNFAGVKSDSRLFWYQLLKDKDDDNWNALIINVLEYFPKERYPVNFTSIMVFFNADYKKAEYKKLEDLYIKAINEGKINFGTNAHIKYQKVFFDEAHNFLETRLVLGKESYDKGNWMNMLRAECKVIPRKKTNKKKLNLEQLKKYKPTELAPGVKKKTN